MTVQDKQVVVMADDDEDDCLVARDAFEESGEEGIFVCVEDGQELMDYLARTDSRPALILLDLNMPRQDGRESLQKIKAMPPFEAIPVVVLTTSQEPRDKTFAREMGAEHFITKPATFGEWVEMMKRLGNHWLNGSSACRQKLENRDSGWHRDGERG